MLPRRQLACSARSPTVRIATSRARPPLRGASSARKASWSSYSAAAIARSFFMRFTFLGKAASRGPAATQRLMGQSEPAQRPSNLIASALARRGGARSAGGVLTPFTALVIVRLRHRHSGGFGNRKAHLAGLVVACRGVQVQYLGPASSTACVRAAAAMLVCGRRPDRERKGKRLKLRYRPLGGNFDLAALAWVSHALARICAMRETCSSLVAQSRARLHGQLTRTVAFSPSEAYV